MSSLSDYPIIKSRIKPPPITWFACAPYEVIYGSFNHRHGHCFLLISHFLSNSSPNIIAITAQFRPIPSSIASSLVGDTRAVSSLIDITHISRTMQSVLPRPILRVATSPSLLRSFSITSTAMSAGDLGSAKPRGFMAEYAWFGRWRHWYLTIGRKDSFTKREAAHEAMYIRQQEKDKSVFFSCLIGFSIIPNRQQGPAS